MSALCDCSLTYHLTLLKISLEQKQSVSQEEDRKRPIKNTHTAKQHESGCDPLVHLLPLRLDNHPAGNV
ncbi:uncharacterized [Lates japonicus]